MQGSTLPLERYVVLLCSDRLPILPDHLINRKTGLLLMIYFFFFRQMLFGVIVWLSLWPSSISALIMVQYINLNFLRETSQGFFVDIFSAHFFKSTNRNSSRGAPHMCCNIFHKFSKYKSLVSCKVLLL